MNRQGNDRGVVDRLWDGLPGWVRGWFNRIRWWVYAVTAAVVASIIVLLLQQVGFVEWLVAAMTGSQ